MNIAQPHHGSSKKLMVLSVLAAIGPALAEEGEDIAQYTKPESSVSVGVGGASGDSRERAIFGQYNGMRNHSGSLLLDVDMINREDATGKWSTLEGRNLGLDDRELRYSQQRQGDWKYYVDYNQLTHHEIRTINTGMQGAGTTTPSVTLLSAPGTGNDLDLKVRRESVGFGMDKWFGPSLKFELTAKNEDKEGARLWGKGFACTSGAAPLPTSTSQIGCAAGTQWALLMLPEPINSSTRQFEAKLNFSTDKLLLTGGYYGSFYNNVYGSLRPTVPGTLNNPLGVPTALNTPAGAGMTQLNGLQGILQMPMALPPDNEAHQFYVSGNYAFTPTTRTTFKYAFTRAKQNDNFLGNGLTDAPSNRADLGGKIDTHLLQLGLTTRPVQKLSVIANLRYEDRKDKTPQALYSVEGTEPFANSKYSLKRLTGKLEGSYQLPDNYRATLGADYELMDRGEFTSPGCAAIDPTTGDCLGSSIAGLWAVRAKTEEIGWRAELRRGLSETLSGAVSYASSRRDGASNWLKLNSLPATGVTELSDSAIYNPTGAFPMMFENRIRDKVKLSADWYATQRLSLQFSVEDAKDSYGAPTTKGLRDSGYLLYSIDATLNLSEKWKLTGYWSQNDQELHVAHSTGYNATIRTLNTTLGIGIAGKPSSRLEVGTDLSYLNDSTKYNQLLDSAANANNITFYNQQGGLPEVAYDEFRLRLFGKYTLEKNADLRIDLVHFRARLDEWTWGYGGTPFTYSDNTTVSFDTKQHVTFLGATYIYKWR
jgi:MtrB/PioB family decaheme-associated outer membrane protein